MWTNPELKSHKDYLNSYYLFTDYEIDEYRKDDNFESVRFDLAAQNTGWIIEAKHDLKTDEYTCDVDRKAFPIPDEFLRTIFKVARQYQENIRLESALTDAYVASSSPKF